MEQNTLEIKDHEEVFEFTSIRELVNQTLNKDFGGHNFENHVSTGFHLLDKVTGGFYKGKLHTVAVKPGMGKTAFLLSVANNLAIKNHYSVAIFSSERSGQKITTRLIESETGMSVDRLINGSMKASERDHANSLVGGIAKAKIFLDDTQSLSISDIAKRLKQLKRKHGVDLVIIDYLELLISGIVDNESRQEQLSAIVLHLREIARELNIPVLLFSQTGSTAGFMQKISTKDLPVYLAELSDSLMILHRSDLYHPKRNGSVTNEVELIVVKHPDISGPVPVKLAFIESTAKFVDLQ
ncbi:MAG TPA: DnaB-like helicase C-terminal domain-containing protein [Bacteroidales bacterium]|nr:DnaB-like helicase C-terminal domain-containing protein [Bacteroidales bacterium]